MAVPFVLEDEAEDQHQRLVSLLTDFVAIVNDVLASLAEMRREQLERQRQQRQPGRSRLPPCEEEDEEDGGDDEQPPAVATRVQVAAEAPADAAEMPDLLPDVIPRPAPRPSLQREQRDPRGPRRRPSAFTKYLTADAGAAAPADTCRLPVAESDTTACYALPDLVLGASQSSALGPAPGAALGPAPRPAPRPGAAPRPAIRGPPPRPAPRLAPRQASKRRPCEDAFGGPIRAAPSAMALPAEWLRQREDELEKTLFKMASPGAGAVARAPHSDWVRVGQDLRVLADHFHKAVPSGDVVDGPCAAHPTPSGSSSSSSSILAMFLPTPVKGTFLTTVVFWVGWKLLSSRSR